MSRNLITEIQKLIDNIEYYVEEHYYEIEDYQDDKNDENYKKLQKQETWYDQSVALKANLSTFSTDSQNFRHF